MNPPFIHPSAIIDLPCTIGEGTKIWHFCHVMPSARIGKECTLGQNVFVAQGVQIGDRVKIQNNVSVYAGVTVEDDVFLGPSMVFTNVRFPRSSVYVPPDLYAHTLVQRGASIGANATVMCGITIGAWALVGAGSVVTRDIPAHALVCGNPATVRGWVCACGGKIAAGTPQMRCATCVAHASDPPQA